MAGRVWGAVCYARSQVKMRQEASRRTGRWGRSLLREKPGDYGGGPGHGVIQPRCSNGSGGQGKTSHELHNTDLSISFTLEKVQYLQFRDRERVRERDWGFRRGVLESMWGCVENDKIQCSWEPCTDASQKPTSSYVNARAWADLMLFLTDL